jgi:hypothetical protein
MGYGLDAGFLEKPSDGMRSRRRGRYPSLAFGILAILQMTLSIIYLSQECRCRAQLDSIALGCQFNRIQVF